MSSVMDMGADADTLVDGIDAGDIDPESVDIRPFVEDDDKVLTPELAERLPDDKVERYNELAAERDAKELQREAVELSAEQRTALDDLRPDVGDREEKVQLYDTDTTVTVKTYIDGTVETAIKRIAEEGQKDIPDLGAVREDMIDVMCNQIREEEYAQHDLWEAYAEEYGLQYLMENVMVVTEPAREAVEQQQSFR